MMSLTSKKLLPTAGTGGVKIQSTSGVCSLHLQDGLDAVIFMAKDDI